METGKRLIPYSVHLSEEVYLALKSHAQDRKASSMVRDAITMLLEGGKPFDSGYNQAIRDVLKLINKHDTANFISFHGVSIADDLVEEIKELQK
jgi:hypothetical protein